VKIELESVMGLDDEGICATYARGHHPLAVVLARAAREYAAEFKTAETLPKAEHEWWRKVPVRGNDVCDTRFVGAAPHARGAFPVTVVSFKSFER
jgi:hypothetical protein